MQQVVTCPNCQGHGRLYTTPCAACRGQGISQREEQITINIPLGIEEGMVLRVPGQGVPSRDPEGVPGDLFVILHIASDDRFERRGIDLWQHVTLSVEDCVLGTQVDIPTLQDPFTLDIPAGTQSETVLRLRHYGLPEFGGPHRGDMYVLVQVHLPERLTLEERKQYENLRALKQGKPQPVATTGGPIPRTDTSNTNVSSGFKDWLATSWQQIDTAVRRWLNMA
jgi:molecular chaperone DnaJ